MSISAIILKGIKYLALIFILLTVIILLVLFIPAIWRNNVSYTKKDTQVAEFKSPRQKPPRIININNYRNDPQQNFYADRTTLSEISYLFPY